MAKLTERIVSLLRIMHAGVPLRVMPKGTAMLDTSKIPSGIRRATVEQMVADGLLEHDPSTQRYRITEKGRYAVRVRDDISDFVRTA